MKVIFPVIMEVKLGGSENIFKLYFGRENQFLSYYAPNKIILHFENVTITSPTIKQLQTYHSLNCRRINQYLHSENFTLNSKLTFVATEDKNGNMNLVYVE